MRSGEPTRSGVNSLRKQTLSARVVSVVASAGLAMVGLWAGLFAVGATGQLRATGLLAAVVALLVVEATARPLLRRLAGRGSALWALLLGVVAQQIIAALVLALVAGVRLDGWVDVAVVLGTMAVVTAVGRWVVGAGDEAYVVGHAVRRRGPRDDGSSATRGLVVVQLDGVSAEVLRRAVASGQAPRMSQWFREGTHVLHDWWVPVPSTTPASQAGLLHGDDDQVPGFRWWDRELGRLMVSNRPADAAVVESRFPPGRGLLRDGGVAISTSFSGEADDSFLVFSKAAALGGLGRGSSYIPLFASPFLLPRTLLLTVGEMVKEVHQARRQKIHRVEPRIPRRASYVALRGLTNVFLRTLNLVLVTDAMSRGAPIVFVDFVDYDEIAHHAGPERPESMRALEGLDAVLGELVAVPGRVPTDYEFVIWSDHGQSLGSTFEQRTGLTLARRIEHLMAEDAVTSLESANGDGWGPLNALVATTFRRIASDPGAWEVGPDRGQGRGQLQGEEAAVPDVVVVGGGNLGMAWFPGWPTRPCLADLDERWPGLVPGLALTPGIGVVMVADGAGSAVAGGPYGVHRLATGEVSGTDPLTPYGPRTAGDLRRLASTEHCGDLVILSSVDATGSVHAFEGQVGSHGGIGGLQNNGLLIRPVGLALDEDLLTHDTEPARFTSSVAIHDQIERWRQAQGTL